MPYPSLAAIFSIKVEREQRVEIEVSDADRKAINEARREALSVEVESHKTSANKPMRRIAF